MIEFGFDLDTMLFFLPVLVLPLVSAMIGWITNYVAIKMLFRPHEPKRVLFMTFQGLIPKRHSDLAEAIADAVEKDFFTKDSLKDLIGSVDFAPLISDFIMKKWDEKILSLTESNPMLKMFAIPGGMNVLKEQVANSFVGNFSKDSEVLAEKIASGADISGIIRKNILAFDYTQLEEVIERLAKKEFKYIERLGGLLGFIIGIIQVLFFYHPLLIDLFRKLIGN